MKIAVVSPAGRCGATAATLLMGHALAYTQGRTVRICYTGENNAVKRYMGRGSEMHDATRTISQVSKLLEARAIRPEDLGDYCVRLGPNIDLMDSWDKALTEEEIISLLVYTFSRNVTDYIFCDLAYDIDDPTSQEVLKVSDAVVVVSEPSRSSLQAIAELQKSSAWPKEKPCMLLISKYHESIDSMKKLADSAQFKLRATCKLHYNPLITRLCNHDQLDTLMPFIVARDSRVIELNNDLKECVQFFLSLEGLKIKWEG